MEKEQEIERLQLEVKLQEKTREQEEQWRLKVEAQLEEIRDIKDTTNSGL